MHKKYHFIWNIHLCVDQQTIYKYCPLWLDRKNTNKKKREEKSAQNSEKSALFGLSYGLSIPLNENTNPLGHDYSGTAQVSAWYYANENIIEPRWMKKKLQLCVITGDTIEG